MKKYLMLVGLMLAGMPLITSCVDNDESASVTKVRDAKAEELLSKAILNKANAQAAEAQAILIKAQAALTEAQTELARINAELAKVQLESARVELEAQKAKLEAIKAQAELDIKRAAQQLQEIAQQMEKSKLQNEIDMAKKMQELLDAVAANNDANRTKLASLLNSMQTSESNILTWQANIYKYESYIVQLEAEIADPMALIAEDIETLKSWIAEEEANIAAAKELLTKDSKELNAELAALNEDYVKVANEYWALADQIDENNEAIDEIKAGDDYKTFNAGAIRDSYNNAGLSSWSGYQMSYYTSTKDGVSTRMYFYREPGKTDKNYYATAISTKGGKDVAGGSFDLEAANALKTAVLAKSAEILADYQAYNGWSAPVYYYNEEVSPYPQYEYDEQSRIAYQEKTLQEHFDYYTDILNRAKIDEKRAAIEAKSAESEAAQSKVDEAKAAEQEAWYTWKNSNDPYAQSNESKAVDAAYNAWVNYWTGKEYEAASEAAYENPYTFYSKESLDDAKIAQLTEIQKKNEELKTKNTEIETSKKELEAANKALADAEKALKEKEADKQKKYDAWFAARVAYANDPSDSNQKAVDGAEKTYIAVATEYETAQGNVDTAKAAVSTAEKKKTDAESAVKDINDAIKACNDKITLIDNAPAVAAAFKAVTDKDQALYKEYTAAQKALEDAQKAKKETYSPLYTAYMEAVAAREEAVAAKGDIDDEISNLSYLVYSFSGIEELAKSCADYLKAAADEKADRDEDVEKVFADVEKMPAAAEAQCKAVEEIVALDAKNAEITKSQEELWKEMTKIKADKGAIETILAGTTLDDAVVDPQTGDVIVPATVVEGVEAIEARIANSEANIEFYNEIIDLLIETANTYATTDGPAYIEMYKREIETLKAKIAAEEAILANLKAEYEATLAAIK